MLRTNKSLLLLMFDFTSSYSDLNVETRTVLKLIEERISRNCELLHSEHSDLKRTHTDLEQDADHSSTSSLSVPGKEKEKKKCKI